MSAAALALALGAAGIHALWNLLLAGARDSQAATAVAIAVSGIAGAPAASLWWHVAAGAWPFIVVSSALELTYFALLAAAYHRAELSVVYPLARGLAPVLVLLGSVVITGAHTTAEQVLGVLLIAAGVLLVRGIRDAPLEGVIFGLLIACCIASYTVVDKHGVAHATPLAYLELVTIFMGVPYVVVIARTRGVAALRSELRPRAIVAGVATFAAYALVLAALRLAPAASVAAVRETSVLIAIPVAAVILHERVTPWRFAGAVLVVGGIALLAL